MVELVTDGMILLGSALMVYNIYGFVSFARKIRSSENWGDKENYLYLPIVLLVLFFLGYLAVALFGKPDLIVSGILFGGSIFVYVMYRYLDLVTQRIVENEQLKAQLTASELSNKTKSTFLASMSHEMRTPMNVIIGLDEVALTNPELPAQTRDQLLKIGDAARHLLGLINNILELNQLEAGELVLKNEPFRLCKTLNQIDALISTLCEEKGLEYRPERDGRIQCACIGDELQLKQMLLSMLDNAVKYTEAPGTVSLKSELLSSEEHRQAVRFTIADTGIGMDESFLKEIFEPFAIEDSSMTNRYGGSGLGLAVAKYIADRMGATISVASVKGEGSTFTVDVPLEVGEPSTFDDCQAEMDNPRKSEPEAAPGDSPAPVSLEGRRILIVEDVPENAEIVADLLELEDAETEHAENGQIAVDLFAKSEPGTYDAVLMDLRMPVMDGFEATRKIRALDHPDAQTVPIIALTANAFDVDVQNALDAGMNAHLAKPADADLLYDTIKQLIGQREMREA